MIFEVVNSIAAVATLLIIAVTAVAALRQIKHLRASNQLAGLITVLNAQSDPVFLSRLHFVQTELRDRLKDSDFVRSYEQVPIDASRHPETYVCGFFEQIGCYLKYDLLDEPSLMDTSCDTIVNMWATLSPTIAALRKVRGPGLYDNFEYLVARAQAWLRKYPDGNYPAGTPHVHLASA